MIETERWAREIYKLKREMLCILDGNVFGLYRVLMRKEKRETKYGIRLLFIRCTPRWTQVYVFNTNYDLFFFFIFSCFLYIYLLLWQCVCTFRQVDIAAALSGVPCFILYESCIVLFIEFLPIKCFYQMKLHIPVMVNLKKK